MLGLLLQVVGECVLRTKGKHERKENAGQLTRACAEKRTYDEGGGGTLRGDRVD